MTRDELIEGLRGIRREASLNADEVSIVDQAIAVFEQAHTPTDDEPVIDDDTDDAWQAIADALGNLGYDLNSHEHTAEWVQQYLFRRIPSTPSDDEREALRIAAIDELLTLGEDDDREALEPLRDAIKRALRNVKWTETADLLGYIPEGVLGMYADAVLAALRKHGVEGIAGPSTTATSTPAGFRRTVQGEPTERDIEYRPSPESDDWVIAILAASERDVATAQRENERLGWQKYRVSGVEPETQGEPSGRMIDTYSHDDLREAFGVQGEPTVEEWAARIRAARAKAIAKGYTPEHDAKHGVRHLLNWAIDYARRGRPEDSSGLMAAAMDLAEIAYAELERLRHVADTMRAVSEALRTRYTRDSQAAYFMRQIDAALDAVREPQGKPTDALDLDALERLAKAATPGPWEFIFGGPEQDESGGWYEPTESGVRSGDWENDFPHADAEFIAAVDPQTVLALIAALRAAATVREEGRGHPPTPESTREEPKT